MDGENSKIELAQHKRFDTYEDKKESDHITDEPPIEENNSPLFKESSFNLKEIKIPKRIFSKQRSSLHAERNKSPTSMHKIVMQRNLFRKITTIDPPILDEFLDSNEFSTHRSIHSKFNVKYGTVILFFYSKI